MRLSGPNGIDKDTYYKCLGPLGLIENVIVERMFSVILKDVFSSNGVTFPQFYDLNGDGYITYDEFVVGMSILSKGAQEEKIRSFIFCNDIRISSSSERRICWL